MDSGAAGGMVGAADDGSGDDAADGDAAGGDAADGTTLRPAVRERLPVALGATGAAVAGALVVVGVYVISFDSLTGAELGSSAGSHVPGLIMSVLLVAAGIGLQLWRRSAALGAAGIAMLAVGVPATVWFATWDAGDLPPTDIGTVLCVSGVVLTILYLVGPARDHATLLGVGITSLWLSALELGEEVFSSTYRLFGLFSFPYLSSPELSEGLFFIEEDLPDPTNVGLLCLFFGFSYVGIAWWCDRQGRRGTATPLLGVGLVALALATSYLQEDLGTGGAGFLLAVIGAAVLGLGAHLDRRATARLGGVGVVVGLAMVVTDTLEDDPSLAGLVLVLLGVVGVGLAHAVAEARNEADPYAPPESTAPPVASGEASWDALGPPRATGPFEDTSPHPREPAGWPEHPPARPPPDEPPGPGWWQASDGRWYPPDQHPGSG